MDKKWFNFVFVYRPPYVLVSRFLEDFATLIEFLQSLLLKLPLLVNSTLTSINKMLMFQSTLHFLPHSTLNLHGEILDHVVTQVDSGLIKSLITDEQTTFSYRQFNKIDLPKLKEDLLGFRSH